MKKALLPLLWVLAAILVLALAGYVYDAKFGAEGPFESQHQHSADDGHDHTNETAAEHEGHDH